MALGLVHISSGAILHCRKSRPPPPPFHPQPHFTLISEPEALHILQSKREETAGKHRRPEEKGGAKTRQCVARPAVLRSGGSLRQPPYGQTLPVCGRIAGPYRADSCTRHTATQPGLTCTPIRPYLHSYRALPAPQSGPTCTPIRPYLHLNQALPAFQSGLTCKADQGSSGHPTKAGGRPGRCFSPGDRCERLLTDVTVYVYLRNKNYGVNIYCASCRYLCPTSAGAVFPSRPALRRI